MVVVTLAVLDAFLLVLKIGKSLGEREARSFAYMRGRLTLRWVTWQLKVCDKRATKSHALARYRTGASNTWLPTWEDSAAFSEEGSSIIVFHSAEVLWPTLLQHKPRRSSGPIESDDHLHLSLMQD